MTTIDNVTVRDDKTCPYEKFNDGIKPKIWSNLRVFGEMAVVKKHKKIMNKLKDRGFEAIWLGYGLNHPNNTFRFMNLKNHEIIHSRDYTWLNMTLNEYRNGKRTGNGVLKLRFLEENDQRMTRSMTRVIGDKNDELSEELDDIVEVEDYVHDVDQVNESP